MFEFTESIMIEAPSDTVWIYLANVEQWWPPSNQEHIRIEVRSENKPVDVGTEIVFEESVAGIKGRAEGRITRWISGSEATWEGIAVYRYMGISFQIREGVSWRVEAQGETSKLSARVWAEFPPGVFGRFLEWYTKTLLNVVERDREHARRELEYLKSSIENADEHGVN